MSKPAQSERTPFERFEDLARKVVSVPKKEVEKKERERLAKKNGRRKKA